jgi:hypothetical protein
MMYASYSREARRRASRESTSRKTPMQDPANMLLLVMCQLLERKPVLRSVGEVMEAWRVVGAYKSRSCSSSTTSVISRSVRSCVIRKLILTEILQPSPIPPMPPISASVAAGIAAVLVAVPISIDIVLDIADMSMASVVGVAERAGLIAM